MPSQFFGLSIASSGLRAANAALNTTANNIANVKTDGYSRQQVIQESADALRVFSTYGCAGAGVDTIAIERMRDGFYDTRFRNNNTTLGEYDAKLYYTGSIEEYFDDGDGKSGFTAIFSKFEAALQSITTNQNSTESKRQFISTAMSLAEYFNNTASNLQKLQKDVNSEIKLRIERINSISKEIATLNKQINMIEMSAGKANELRDKRDLLLDNLSEIVDVKTEELPIVDANNPDRQTGGNRFIVRIAGGQTLVDGYDNNTLSCISRKPNEKVNQTDADGLFDVVWQNGEEFNLYNAAMGGQLKGLVAMRDGNNNQGFDGTVTGIGLSPDGRDSTVTIKVTAEHMLNTNKCNLSDTGGSIIIGNTEYFYKSWEFDPATSSYTFRMDDEKSDSIPSWDKVGKEASVGADVNYQGIPYYLEQMNEFVRAFSAKVNEIFMAGFGSLGETGNMLFTAKKPTPGANKSDDEYAFGDFSDANGYYEMTAFNLVVNKDLIGNPDLLGTRTNAEDGNAEFGKVTELIETLKDKTKFNFRNGTASEFLQCILSDVALNASNAEHFYDTYKGIAVTIETQRISVSGVDEDEEATNLVKFQYSYNLASKMIQTLTEIYDRLILQTGV